MLRNLLTLVLLVAALQAGAYGGNSKRYGSDEGAYVYFGLGGAGAGKAVLGGGELLIAGNIYRGRLLAGVNGSIFRGASPENFGYTLPGVNYNYRDYSMGLNVGMRLLSGNHMDLTTHVLFGEELLELGAKDSIGDCHCGTYHALATNDMWFVRPTISFNNRRNFAMSASYNFLFNDALFSADGPSFGNNAADFNGPMMSLIWITDRRNRPYHYHWHHRC